MLKKDSVYKERRDKVIQNRMEMINDDTITKNKNIHSRILS